MAHRWVLFRVLSWGGGLLSLVLASASAQAAPPPVLTVSKANIALGLPSDAVAPTDLPPIDLSAAFLATLGADASPAGVASLDAFAAADSTLEFAEVPGADSALSPTELPTAELPTAELSPTELPATKLSTTEMPAAGASSAGLMPLVSAAVGAPPPAPEADVAPLAQVRTAPDGDGWEYVIEPYLFIPLSVQATVNVSGVSSRPRQGWGIFSTSIAFWLGRCALKPATRSMVSLPISPTSMPARAAA
ncbi:MAG: hypothetical protein KME14_07720 [Tildeniella torsiva UHER 1998/13D]|nr:hypothetical protein [Tildeniella torsiva UHER 1998/13D]